MRCEAYSLVIQVLMTTLMVDFGAKVTVHIPPPGHPGQASPSRARAGIHNPCLGLWIPDSRYGARAVLGHNATQQTAVCVSNLGMSDVSELYQQPSIDTQLAEAATICRAALAAPKFVGLADRLPGAPADGQGWFDLLGSYPCAPACTEAVERMNSAWPAEARLTGASFEQYAVLHALTVAAPRVSAAPVANSVKRLYAAMCAEVATPTKQWQSHFDLHGGRFLDLCWLASLKRFPAGEMAFDFVPAIPRSAPLRIRPSALPGLLRYVALDMGGLGPVVSPHLNYARPNTLILQEVEVNRSLWRIAKTLEMNPQVKGFAAVSWFYSAQVAKFFPHLAWLRSTFIDEGAYVVDMEPARAGRWGFEHNSPKRRKLYEEGKFCPRQTLVLWRRDAMMDWARSHPELADEPDEPLASPGKSNRRQRARSPEPARAAKHNSPITIWNGLDYSGRKPVSYVLRVLLLPPLAIGLAVALAVAWWAGVPAFVAAFVAAWLFQYYFFQ